MNSLTFLRPRPSNPSIRNEPSRRGVHPRIDPFAFCAGKGSSRPECMMSATNKPAVCCLGDTKESSLRSCPSLPRLLRFRTERCWMCCSRHPQTFCSRSQCSFPARSPSFLSSFRNIGHKSHRGRTNSEVGKALPVSTSVLPVLRKPFETGVSSAILPTRTTAGSNHRLRFSPRPTPSNGRPPCVLAGHSNRPVFDR